MKLNESEIKILYPLICVKLRVIALTIYVSIKIIRKKNMKEHGKIWLRRFSKDGYKFQ